MTEDVTETMSGTGTKPLGKSTRGGHSGLASDLQPGGTQPGGGPARGVGSIGNEGPEKAKAPPRGAGPRRGTAKKL